MYALAGGDPGSRVALPAFAAALAFFVVNNLLVEAVLVLAGGGPALGGPGARFELRLPLTPIAHPPLPDPEPVAYAASRR